MKILGIIPARGGSKGVKKKNIRLLKDKPLIYWTLNECEKINDELDFIVSTDDEEIAEICSKYNFPVHSLRPDHLATDNALTLDVLTHELLEYEKRMSVSFDYVLLLQPTCPMRKSDHIVDCINLIKKYSPDSVVSIKDVQGNHPNRMKIIDEGMLVNYVDTGIEDMRPRQSLPKVFIRNGAIYLTKAELIRENKTLVGEKCIPYLMDENDSINIDTELDFLTAEQLFS